MEVIYPAQGENKTVIVESLTLTPGVTYRYYYGRKIGSTAKVLYYIYNLATGDTLTLANILKCDDFPITTDTLTVSALSGTQHKTLAVSKDYADIIEITVTIPTSNAITMKIAVIEY